MAVQLPFRLPNLGPRTRRILRYVGLTVLGLVVFVFALQMTFPYERVKDKVVEAMADKYDVTIGSVDRGFFPGNVTFNAVTVRTRQTKADETVTTFFINQLELKAGILSLLGGTISMDIEATIGPGTLTGDVAVGKFGKGDINVHFVGSRLPGDALPMRAALGLPMTGKIDFDVSLALPMEKSKMGKTAINWQKASGAFSLGCPTGCTFGDGKTKLKPLLKNTRNQVMVGEGIDFGKVTMDSLIAKASIKGGTLTVDRFETKSKDGELHIDYMMTLEKDFGESMVAGCLRFKGTDDLLKREPKTYAALQTTGAELRNDGLFHIKLTDRFKDMKRLNKECGPGANTNGNGEYFDNKRDRPNLTVTPDDDPPSQGSAIAAPPPPPPTPTPTPTPAETPPPTDDTNPTGAEQPQPQPATPNGNDGVAPTPSLSNDPPRERPGEQGRIEPPPQGSGGLPDGDGQVEPAMPPPE